MTTREVTNERDDTYDGQSDYVTTSSQKESYQHASLPHYKHPIIACEIINISEKVMVPVKEYPKYNFLGKLLGPKGSTLKNIAASTKSKISILGQGSTRDRTREEELSKSDEPEHQHFKEPLHVLIQVKAPRIEAHTRMSAALKEINKYMEPESELHPQSPAMEAQHIKVVDRALPGAPMIRFGIPPPGAIILGQPTIAAEAPMGRFDGRPNHRPIRFPSKNTVVRDPYPSYTSKDTTPYQNYPESKDPHNYDYNDNDQSTYRPGEKRVSTITDYSTKKYRESTYSDAPSYSTKPDPDPYYSTPQYTSKDGYYM